jgi:hypothetical protein
MAFADQPVPTATSQNRLLRALPPEDLARLWPRLERVELEFRKTLHAPEADWQRLLPRDRLLFPAGSYGRRR